MKFTGVVYVDPLIGDFNRSCKVDLVDIAIFSAAWMTSQGDPDYDEACDISPVNDNQITIDDLAVVTENWMAVYGR